MVNQVSLLGRVGKDPAVRSLNDGGKVANFSIATSERWKDKQSGERKEKTEWHNVVVWGNLAGIVDQYVKKGSQIFIQGKLQTRKWQDQQGNDRYTTEVVLQGFDAKLQLLDSKGAREPGEDRDDDDDDRRESTPRNAEAAKNKWDDEIPF